MLADGSRWRTGGGRAIFTEFGTHGVDVDPLWRFAPHPEGDHEEKRRSRVGSSCSILEMGELGASAVLRFQYITIIGYVSQNDD